MNHDASHCLDYDKDICPKDCYRAELTQDLRDNIDIYAEIPMSWAHFKGTQYCKKWPNKRKD